MTEKETGSTSQVDRNYRDTKSITFSASDLRYHCIAVDALRPFLVTVLVSEAHPSHTGTYYDTLGQSILPHIDPVYIPRCISYIALKLGPLYPRS